MNTVMNRLLAAGEDAYGDFQSKLLPTLPRDRVIGVRTPVLRKLAKQLRETPEAAQFLAALPHRYFEENNLHGFLIEQIQDFDACVAELNRFLPYVDNWATCDQMSPKVLKKDLPRLLAQIKIWIASEHTYTVRYGVGMLMRYFLDEAFCPAYLQWVAEIQTEEYYVNMVAAWFFAEALVRQYDAAVCYLEQHRLSTWVHNKAIQKARESFRISPMQKAYLQTLKVKGSG